MNPHEQIRLLQQQLNDIGKQLAALQRLERIDTSAIDGYVTGGGTVATGGYALTVGTPSYLAGSVNGYVTGGGTVATGGFALTVPAAGTAMLLGGSQTATGVKTFSNGISFGNETLAAYDEGTWSPAITAAGSNPTVTYTIQAGRYTRIGNVVFYSFFIQIATISGGSGDIRISLPLTAASGDANNPPSTIQIGGPSFGGTPMAAAAVVLAGNANCYVAASQNNASTTNLAVSGLSASDFIVAEGFYFV